MATLANKKPLAHQLLKTLRVDLRSTAQQASQLRLVHMLRQRVQIFVTFFTKLAHRETVTQLTYTTFFDSLSLSSNSLVSLTNLHLNTATSLMATFHSAALNQLEANNVKQ